MEAKRILPSYIDQGYNIIYMPNLQHNIQLYSWAPGGLYIRTNYSWPPAGLCIVILILNPKTVPGCTQPVIKFHFLLNKFSENCH